MDISNPKRRDLLKMSGAALALTATPVLARSIPTGPLHVTRDRPVFSQWQFRQADTTDWMAATVPGTVHTDLLANSKIEDPFYRTNERDLQWIDKKDWEYRTTFSIKEDAFARQHIALVFAGLDTYADVYVNDALVLSADNMFREWAADIKAVAKPGDNDLRVYFHSPVTVGLKKLAEYGFNLPASNDQSENGGLGADKVSVFTRKAGYAYGWDWGPRFVTSGVWRPLHLRAWDDVHINDVQLVQDSVTPAVAKITAVVTIDSAAGGAVAVMLKCQDDHTISARAEVKLTPGENRVELAFTIKNPKLWWSNGLGEAYLYPIYVDLLAETGEIDTRGVNLGVRTLRVVQKPDDKGASFYVELNGVPVFMKGANYIPNDSFLPRVTHEVYDKVVGSAVATHMNMLRVWGGGVYEDDYFYDLCDRNGILVWQDFMFACSMYPNDDAFLDNVRQEAIQNVRRLRNHPSLAIWVGNNEIDSAWQNDVPEGGWGWKQTYTPEQRAKIWAGYDAIFNHILPAVIAAEDPQRLYWPSSPFAGNGQHADVSRPLQTGDIHYWDVWWGQKPFAEYRTHIGRFMSEYGFQSFPEFNTVKTYAAPGDYDIFSEVMQAHQRSSIGNGTIKNYMQRDYVVPADFEQFLYVGQVLQAEGIKTAMEAHRSRMPYCMGSLFWQINDCWPVASWSSIDYYGRWKAQQYFAVKAFDKVLISPQIDDATLSVYVVSDELKDQAAILSLRVIDFVGRVLSHTEMPLVVKANTSVKVLSQDVAAVLAGADPGKVLLSTRVMQGGQVLADNIVYFKPVKDLVLPSPAIQMTLRSDGEGGLLTLTPDALVKNLYLSLDAADGVFSDNYFDILPGETVKVRVKSALGPKALDARLKQLHMADISDVVVPAA